MTDRLTPGMLRDLADLCAVGNRVVTLTANGETTRFYPNKDLAYVFREEAARREAKLPEGCANCAPGNCAGPCARREAEAKPQHATACEYPHCGCTARRLCKYKVERGGPCSAAAQAVEVAPDDEALLDALINAHSSCRTSFTQEDIEASQEWFTEARAAVLDRMAGKVPTGYVLVPDQSSKKDPEAPRK